MKNNIDKSLLSNRTVSLQFGLLILVLLLAAALNSWGQSTINPVRYWTFNGADATKDSMNNFNLNFNMYLSQYTVGNNGQVGKYVTLNENSWLVDGGPVTLNTGLTVEFLMKPGYKFNSTKFISRGDDVFFIRMEYPKLTFYTFHISGTGAYIMDEFVVDLNGTGRKSYGYYIDGNWHHMAFKMNTATGVKEIWVDGQLPAGFSKTLATGTFPNAGNSNIYLNHNVNYVKYHGSLDEIAIYNTAIPSQLIYKHYLGVQNGQPYSFLNDYSQSIPPAASVTGGIDINEYPAGHPNVTASAISQLNNYPAPRYKPGHTLNPNFNWMDPKYMGGLFQPGVTTQMAVNNSTIIQTELAKNFNYYFNVGAANDAFDHAWVAAANANPDFKLGMTIFRAQLNGNRPDLTSQTKPNDHYLQNANGQFIDPDGNVTTTYKYWRPTAPTSSYVADGNSILSSLNYLFGNLNRGVDLINENGEVFPLLTQIAASKDPVVTAAKNASGLSWEDFLGKKFMENETQSYRNIFMSHPKMANKKFTEFAIDGYAQYRYSYSEARKANSMINGQYYSTPDFYPRWPYNWRNWVSAWHGWQWIVETRVNELAVGDKLFSPFVCAGWDPNEEINMRPAQWLGLLKTLNMAGAEFFYSCYFSLSAPFPDSKNWIWQAAVPSYAQAVASRYEDFLRNGTLMNGDVANSYINPTAPGYSFWAGDLRKLVVARKHNNGPKYAITGTIQPNSNIIDATEHESTATITIDGNTISFKVRRQGSTYIYDRTTTDPVFYQLDRFHEKTHPSRWSKDFDFDAELFDNNNTQVILKTTVPAGTPSGDYTNFTTYITWPDNAQTFTPVEYQFMPRSGGNNELYLWVRARSRGGVATSMNVKIDNGTERTIGCISDTAWTWYRYDACTQDAINYSGLSLQNHKLVITPGNSKLEIDRVLLTTEGTLLLNSAPPVCGSGTATITSNGPTNFCTGGNVILTASAGTSYLWSPGGQTTQSITVNSTGNYYVNVSSGSGCAATSSPVAVTVSQAPVATITANGPTTICNGGSVTLTASSGSSYLWTPGGQTSQSINVTSSGTYSVRVTNSTGCSSVSAPQAVTVSSIPTANITAGGPTTFCNGGSVVLTASAGSSYLWSPGGQTTQSITATAAGSYTVRVTNGAGCSKTSSPVVVNVSAVPNAAIAPNGPTTFCTGGSVTLFSSAGASYLWTPGGQTTQSINVTSSGNYSVRVTNSSGCTAVSSITAVNVVAPPVATITANGPLAFCPGGSVTLTASPGSSYLWTPGGQTTQSITASAAGSYSVKVTNSTGCSATSAPATVSITSNPVATITANGSTSICPGETVSLTASNGTSYLWNNGETTQTIDVSSGGNYSVVVYNGSGCSATAPAQTVTMLPGVNATITPSGPTTFQQGQSITLTAGGGTSYVWTPDGETTNAITVTSSGIYKVIATNASGCTGTSAPVTVEVIPVTAPPATITTSGTGAICPGENITLTASAGSAYLWSPGGETTPSITVNTTGTYTVTVTDITGTTSSSASVLVTAKPIPGMPVITSGYIPNSSYQLTAFEPTAHSYRWSNGSTANSITVSSPGNYTVRAVNKLGCKSSPETITITSVAPQPCIAANMLAQSAVTGTSATLSWNPAVTADSFRVTYTNIATSVSQSVTVAGNTSSVTINDLVEGTTYNWKVTTICGSNNLSSILEQFTTLSAPLPCGSTPQDLSTDAVNATYAKVSWYDTQADYFVLRYKEVGSPVYNYRRAFNTLTDGMLMGLTPGTTYEWSVRSICGNMVSLFSPNMYFTTLTACPSLGIISATEIAFDKVKLNWNASVAVDTIIIRYGIAGTQEQRSTRIEGTPNPGFYMLTGLQPETEYEVIVRSKCSSGSTSMWTIPVRFTTLAAPSLRFEEESGPLHVNAYPNPTRNSINYVFESKNELPYTVKVCDMAGKELFSEVRIANEGMHGEKISLSGFASGLYMLIVQQGPMSGRFKFNLQE